ncbi:helix-turn-helix domain-containing protein [Phenylobacterium sp.]|uniref:helix-turn-helix domain-containing protein n=1 Tax=Phenylobacterium sp. TaxID=1871053 RepID=UPI00273678D8|nr:AraC family transcriptional regulator [Phenylobacterium sp.]MDP3852280.1 AraC family transcriptional regulator [Phenylobacterium sp.]
MLEVLDLVARGAVGGLAILAAGLILRAGARGDASWLSAAFAVGVAAHAWCSAPGFEFQPSPLHVAALALTSGNPAVAWLLARSLFREGRRPRAWWLLAWSIPVAGGLAAGLTAAAAPAISTALDLATAFMALAFAGLALLETAATWRDDLVNARRRLRVLLVVAFAGATMLNTGLAVAFDSSAGPASVSLIMSGSVLAATFAVLWELLRARTGGLFEGGGHPTAARVVEPVDPVLLERLQSLMSVERAYRSDLTVASLAGRLALPEHRLRRLINAGLGHRNFAAFVNGYRVDEAAQALADPEQDGVPVLTIALDTGFASVGPFNRAFKTRTGLTPTEYRRRARTG